MAAGLHAYGLGGGDPVSYGDPYGLSSTLAGDRLVATYGGDADDWAKMSTGTRVAPDGTHISVHWCENVKTGLRVEF